MANRMFQWAALLAALQVLNVSADHEEPFVSNDGFSVITLNPNIKEPAGLARCNSWIRMPTGTSVDFRDRRKKKRRNLPRTCRHVFEAINKDDRIAFSCKHFRMKRKYHGECLNKALNIFTADERLERFCGDEGPFNFVTPNHWAFILFEPSPFRRIKKRHPSWRGRNPALRRRKRHLSRRKTFYFRCTATAVASENVSGQISNPTTGVNPSSKNCKCGRRGSSQRVRIVGGADADIHEFPWQAALVDKENPTQVVCGGVLINSKFVLTAAHCVTFPNDPTTLQVSLGDHDTSTTTETSATTYINIESVVVHNEFDFVNLDNDIALLRLGSEVDLEASEAIKPICLPSGNERYDGKEATISGWGLLGVSGQQPNILQHVALTTMANSDCKILTPFGPITDNMICATASGKDACMGDGGGPKVVQDGDHYDLIGIISHSVICGNSLFPRVFVRVGNYIDWIKDNVGEAETCAQ